ncbi:MAG: hypothetical protein ACOCP8_08755 [archaeon]
MIKEIIILTIILVIIFLIISFIKKAVSTTFGIIFKLSIIIIAIFLILTVYSVISFYNSGYFEESEILVFSKDKLVTGFSIEDGKIMKNNPENSINNTHKKNILKMIENGSMSKILNKEKFIITEHDKITSNLSINNYSNYTKPLKMIKNIGNFTDKEYNISFLPKTLSTKFVEIFIN